MKKLLMYNPNTSQSVTQRMAAACAAHPREGWQVDCLTAPSGVAAIETAADEVVAAKVALDTLSERQGGYDAAVLGCFADPGLAAVREALSIPVVGILEASLYRCCLQGGLFSVIATGGSGDIAAFQEYVARYGLTPRLAGVAWLGLGVLGVNEASYGAIADAVRRCAGQDGASSVVLGCAAFAGMGPRLSADTGVYVTDGIAPSLGMACMLAEERAEVQP